MARTDGLMTALYAREIKALNSAAGLLRWNADTNAKLNKADTKQCLRLADVLQEILTRRGIS